MKRNGRLIMIDGIAGSGKSTVVKAIQQWSEECRHRIFRLCDWKETFPPRFQDTPDCDIYFTYEPTRSWVGAAIRYELSRKDDPYGGEELAHAFALDRHIMYRRLILPALEAGKTVIQDRGVYTSLVYQPIMPNAISLEAVMALAGNQLALARAPDALILTKLPAHMAHDRILKREEEGKGVFSNLDFLIQLEQRFEEPWLSALFEKQGTRLFRLNTEGSLEESRTKAQELVKHILTIC